MQIDKNLERAIDNANNEKRFWLIWFNVYIEYFDSPSKTIQCDNYWEPIETTGYQVPNLHTIQKHESSLWVRGWVKISQVQEISCNDYDQYKTIKELELKTDKVAT